MTTKFYLLMVSTVLCGLTTGLAQRARVSHYQEPQDILEGKLRQLTADNEQLAQQIKSLDRRAEENGAEQKEFLSQLKRLEAALAVVKLQMAAITARQLSYNDAKSVLETKAKINAAERKAAEADKSLLEVTKRNIPEELTKAKLDQTSAQNALTTISATLPPLEAKAKKSRDEANADAKVVLETKAKISAAKGKLAEMRRLILEVAKKKDPQEITKSKKDQAAAQDSLNAINATLLPLEAKAKKSDTDAAADAKPVLETKAKIDAAKRKAAEMDKLAMEVAKKNNPEELTKAKADDAAAQTALKTIKATLPPLETKAKKSQDDADAALISAARDAASLEKDAPPLEKTKKAR